MRRPILFLLAFAIVLITCARARAQEVVVTVADPQAAQGADKRQVEVQRTLQAAQQGIDKLKVELKVATSSMLGAVVTGAPYSAVTTNESVQALVDGNRIVQRSTYNVARDGQGRVRREEMSDTGAVASVMIMDPVGNASYVLDPTNRTVRKMTLLRQNVLVHTTREGDAVSGTLPKSTAVVADELKTKITASSSFMYTGGSGGGTFVAATAATNMDVRRESLGAQVMEGVAVEGTRTVSTIPAGQVGNERPIDIVSEQWYSKDLQMTIMSRHADPRTGETTYRVTNIRRGEPDPSLFQVPGDYTVKEPVTEVLPSKVGK